MKKVVWGILCLISLKAMAADVFVMANIPVSAQEKSAVVAQEVAIQKGKRQAFTDLITQIVTPESRSLVVLPTDIESFVQDVSVANEKAGAGRYRGDLTVRFKAPFVRSFLKSQNVSFLSRMPTPMLVIPLFHDGVQSLAFDENNPLFQTLKTRIPASSLFQLKMLSQDSQELEIAQTAAQNRDYSAFKPLLDKYNLTGVLLITVLKNGSVYQLSTTVFPVGSAPEAEVVLNVTDDREDLFKVMADLTADAVRAMDKKWLYLAQESAQPALVYHVYTPVERVSDLARIQQKVQQIKFADKVEIKGFSNKRLAVDFIFRGTEQELAQKLKLSGMTLTAEPYTDPTKPPVYLLQETGIDRLTPNTDSIPVADAVPDIAPVMDIPVDVQNGQEVGVTTDLIVPAEGISRGIVTQNPTGYGAGDVQQGTSVLETPLRSLVPGMNGQVPVGMGTSPVGVSGSGLPAGVSGSGSSAGVSGSVSPVGVSGSGLPAGVSGSGLPSPVLTPLDSQKETKATVPVL